MARRVLRGRMADAIDTRYNRHCVLIVLRAVVAGPVIVRRMEALMAMSGFR